MTAEDDNHFDIFFWNVWVIKIKQDKTLCIIVEYISRYKVWCKRPPVLWPWYTNQREESPLGPLFFLRDPHGDCFTMSPRRRLGWYAIYTTSERILSQVHCLLTLYLCKRLHCTATHTYLLTQQAAQSWIVSSLGNQWHDTQAQLGAASLASAAAQCDYCNPSCAS